MNHCKRRFLLVLWFLLLLPVLRAHPFLNNTWQVLAERDRLVSRVTATLREVAVVQSLQPAQLTNVPVLLNAVSNHAAYLAQHLRIEADGTPLRIEVLDFQLLLEESAEPEDSDRYPDLTHVAFDLECRVAGTPPGRVTFGHRTLEEYAYAPGIPWDPYYVLMVADAGRRPLGQGVVRKGSPVTLALDPGTTPAARTAAATAVQGGSGLALEARGDVATGFLRHGLHHVLTGYDHLLFLVGLALAARSWGRLLGIIGVFTLAHSVTVTLSAMGWIRAPAWLVEPVIAGSIVAVALQNVLAPGSAAGRSRLVVAFGFGLVHGLGFAGGLAEALGAGQTRSVGWAIAAFCIGVELGHLAVGAPLFGILQAVRTRGDGKPDGSPSGPLERWGSVAVSIGGAWFLWGALKNV